jgi:hypothetical protein
VPRSLPGHPPRADDSPVRRACPGRQQLANHKSNGERYTVFCSIYSMAILAGRVRREFPHIRPLLGTTARMPKPSRPGPGRPKGPHGTPAPRYRLPKKTGVQNKSDITTTRQRLKHQGTSPYRGCCMISPMPQMVRYGTGGICWLPGGSGRAGQGIGPMGHRDNRNVPGGHRANRGWPLWHDYTDQISDI